MKLDIVVRNGNIYVKTKSEGTKVEVVDSDSSVELVDAHYTRITKDENQERSFDLTKLEAKGPRKYRSIVNPVSMFVNGFKTVMNYNTLKKILLIIFLISSVFITYSISNIFGVMNITDDEFVTVDKSYLRLVSKNTDVGYIPSVRERSPLQLCDAGRFPHKSADASGRLFPDPVRVGSHRRIAVGLYEADRD